ncbi:tRNA pseudouridine(38-40) synthase TruA [Candidatus Shikimatogenerans silvanidophilus]|uniref:tRNA pseudouridine(38-40) synthase TruA n=1 Tax=Candidatus Shikimatogenerans silvanidophilus TaxID=2782547 RepID=UPI001BAA9494|nr:tRNA pseudouridine(38-40) synthase TruA [Candidatus Shikimatogenerans silvanidophilus]
MRFFLDISYNGNIYYGWQIQKNNLSIEQILEEKISILLKKKINIIGAGRTDKGVHAIQMIAHFDFNKEIENEIIEKLNNFLPENIKVNKIFRVKDNIHARFNAINRTYKYYIYTKKNLFFKNIFWDITSFSKKKINFSYLKKLEFFLYKQKNFEFFCKKKKKIKNYICNIYYVNWTKKKNFLIFTIRANRFIRCMVRFLVGTMINVGIEKISLETFYNYFLNKNNNNNYNNKKFLAPPFGLFLYKINYPKNILYNNKL